MNLHYTFWPYNLQKIFDLYIYIYIYLVKKVYKRYIYNQLWLQWTYGDTRRTNGKVFESNIFRLIKFHFNQKLQVVEIWNCFKTLMYLQYNKQQTKSRIYGCGFIAQMLFNLNFPGTYTNSKSPTISGIYIVCGGERIGKLSKQRRKEFTSW